MKINKQTLKKIIKEELDKVIRESSDDPAYDANMEDSYAADEMRISDEEYFERKKIVDSGTSPFVFVDKQGEIEYLQRNGLYDPLYDLIMPMGDYVSNENDEIAYFSTMILPKLSDPKFRKLIDRNDIEFYDE